MSDIFTSGNVPYAQLNEVRLDTSVIEKIFNSGSLNVVVVDTLPPPEDSSKGQLVFDDTDGQLKVYDGTMWSAVGVEGLPAPLESIANLPTTEGEMLYTVASNVYDTTTLTPTGRGWLSLSTVPSQQSSLNLVPGTDVQAQSNVLDSLISISATSSRIPFTVGGNYASTDLGGYVRTSFLPSSNAADARTSLELGSAALEDVPAGGGELVTDTSASVFTNKTLDASAVGNSIFLQGADIQGIVIENTTATTASPGDVLAISPGGEATWETLVFPTGDVQGPAISTVGNIATFSNLDGTQVQDSNVNISVGGNITGVNNISAVGTISGTLTTPSQANITQVGTLNGLSITGNINVTGTVDGIELTNLANLASTSTIPDELAQLTQSEIQQLQTIGEANIINTTQWGYLSAQDQLTSTTSSPTFGGLTTTTLVNLNGGATVPTGQVLTLADQPSLDTHGANKLYVDTRVSETFRKGINVQVAGVGNVSLIGGGGVLTLDGVSILENDSQRILLKEQTDSRENGVYTRVLNDGGGNYVLQRTTDFDSSVEPIPSGLSFFVEEGAVKGLSSWVLRDDVSTVGVDNIIFEQNSGSREIRAGDGISISDATSSSPEISVVGTAGRIDISGGTVDIDNSYIGQTSITTLGTITTGTWNGDTIAIANGGTSSTSAGDARTNLGLEIGTDVQAHNTTLDLLSTLPNSIVGDRIIYTSGLDTFDIAPLTGFARQILDDPDAVTVRTTLGLGTAALEDVPDGGEIVTETSASAFTNKTLDASATGNDIILDTATLDGVALTSLGDPDTIGKVLSISSLAPLEASWETPSGNINAPTTAPVAARSIPVFDDTTGNQLGETGVVIDGSDNITGVSTLTATNIGGLLTTAAQPNITSVGILSSLGVAGGDITLSSGGNINLDPSATVDGVDVSELSGLAAAGITINEASQLANINNTTISSVQWGYLGDLDQPLTTTSTPTFDQITLTTRGTISTAPSLDTDIPNKAYVDSVAGAGFRTGEVADTASTSNLTPITYNSATGTITFTGGSTVLTIDDVATAPLDGLRLLIKDQTDPRENGIYTRIADNAGNWVIQRTTDFNSSVEPIDSGVIFFVSEGTVNTNSSWALESDVITFDPPAATPGTSDVKLDQFSGSSNFTAGDGLQLVGSEFSVAGTTGRISVSAGGVDIDNLYTGQTSITTLGTITTGTWNGDTIAIANGGTGATTAPDARTNLGLEIGTNVQAYSSRLDDISTIPTDPTTSQLLTIDTLGDVVPSDVSALGLSLINAPDITTAQQTLDLEVGVDVQAFDIALDSLSTLPDTITSGRIIYSTATNVFGTSVISTDGLELISENFAQMRESLDLEVGVDVQAFDPALQGISGLVTAADQMIYTTASDTYTTTTLTGFARDLLDDVDAATARTTLDAQESSATLTEFAGVTIGNNEILFRDSGGTLTTTPLSDFAVTILDDADATEVKTTISAQDADSRLDDISALPATAPGADGFLTLDSNGDINSTTSSSFGRDFIALSNTADARSDLGLVIGTDVQAYSSALQSISGLSVGTDRLLYTTALNTYASTPLTSFGRSLIDDANPAAARATLGVSIGSNVQAFDTTLQQISDLPATTNAVLSFNGTGDITSAPSTTFGLNLLNSANATTAQTTLNLVPGTDVQAYSSILDDVVVSYNGAVDRILYSSNASGDLDFTTLSSFGRTLIDDGNAAAARTTLGLGDASVLNMPAGGSNVIVDTTATQSLSNKTFDSTTTAFGSNGGAANFSFNTAALTAPNKILTVPDATGEITLTSASQTLENKILTSNTNTIRANQLGVNGNVDGVTINTGAAPATGQVLQATGPANAEWASLPVEFVPQRYYEVSPNAPDDPITRRFTTLEGAIADINSGTAPASNDQVLIHVFPGLYAINNPISIPPFVTISSTSIQGNVVLKATNAANPMLVMQGDVRVEGLIIDGQVGVTSTYATNGIQATYNGLSMNRLDVCNNVTVRNVTNAGFLCDGGNGLGTDRHILLLRNTTVLATVPNITMDTAYRCSNTAILRATDSTVSSFFSVIPTTIVTNAFFVSEDYSVLDLNIVNLNYVVNGLVCGSGVISGSREDYPSLRVSIGQISFVSGVAVWSRENSTIRATDVTIQDDTAKTGYTSQIHFLSTNPPVPDERNLAEITSFTARVDRINVLDGATNNIVEIIGSAKFQDPGENKTRIFGEFSVGSPITPSESVFGEGDSYVTGMTVLKQRADTLAFTDVTAEAASITTPSFDAFTQSAVNGDILYIGGPFAKFPGIKIGLNSALTVSGAGNTSKDAVVWEFFQGAPVNTWTELKILSTQNDTYIPRESLTLGFDDTIVPTTSYQYRFGPVTITSGPNAGATWDLTTINGLTRFWIRCRVIDSSIFTSNPEIEFIKLHSNRTEINKDGFLEYFGTARPRTSIPIPMSQWQTAGGGSRTLGFGLDMSIEILNSRWRHNNTVSQAGYIWIPPVELDTSYPLVLEVVYSIRNNPTVNPIDWELRYTYPTTGDEIVDGGGSSGTLDETETGGGGVITVTTSPTIAIENTQQDRFAFEIDISDLNPTTNNLAIFLRRRQTATDYQQLIFMHTTKLKYVKWCEGEHISF